MKPNLLFITVLFLVFTILVPETFAQDIISTILGKHEDDVNSIAFSPDGQTLASGSDDDTVILWDVARGEQAAVLRGHERNVYSIAFSPDGQTLASGSDDDTVILWDVARGEQAAVLRGHEKTVYSIAFSPDGQTLASGSKDNTVILWDAAHRWQKTVLKGHGDWVYSVAFSPDGQTLASGSGDGTVILWDVTREQKKGTFKVGKTRVFSVAFSPDGQTLASGHWNRTVILWDIARGNRKTTLEGPPLRAVYSVAFSPDGRTLASGDTGGTIILWDVMSGQQKSTLLGHQNKINRIVFHPNGSKLASGSKDGAIRLWDTNTTASPEIVFESQEIDDGSFGWSEGNSNGIIEPGERIELKVTLKNNGAVQVNGVKGFLRTNDSSVKLSTHWVNYGDIPSGSFSPSLIDLINFDKYTFKIEVKDDAPIGDINFKFFAVANNGKTWNFPITLSIAEISLISPENLISEEAFGLHSIYFILKAQHPTLIGIPNTEVTYGHCTITLHIPEDTQAFMFPIETKNDKAKKEGIGLFADAVISIASETEKLFAKQASGIGLAALFIEIIGFLDSLGEYDLKVTFPNMFHSGPGRPDTEIEYLVLLRNERKHLEELSITIEQKYYIGGSLDKLTVSQTKEWDFNSKKDSAAPAIRPLELSEYPPFHFLSPEVRQYLLHQFSSETAKAWQIPDETVMGQNFPNPFNPETWIPYQLAEAADVTLTIYDVKGQVVRTLVLRHQPAGIYQSRSRAAYWDGKNELGESVASGVYFYTLKAGVFTATRKMLIRK